MYKLLSNKFLLYPFVFLIVILIIANVKPVIEIYNKVNEIGFIESSKIILLKITDRATKYASGYYDDKSYWIVESENERLNLKESYIESGTGIINNYINPAPLANSVSSFVDNSNSKNYRIASFQPIKNPLKIWSYISSVKYPTQMTPVHYQNGILINDANNQLTKIDASSGKVLWKKEFKEKQVAQRGVLLVDDIIYLIASENLIAINYLTGNYIESFGENGKLLLNNNVGIEPKLWKNLIVLVARNAEVILVDKNNGKVFKKIKLKDESNLKRAGGLPSLYSSPRVWGGVALDSSREILYITTSDPGPVLVGVDRPGSNLLSNSLIAFDLNSHEILWSYQDVAHDLWDLDVAAPPGLSTIAHNGIIMDVVTIIGKSGNVYTLNRDTGESIHDVQYVRVPTSSIIGEKTSPYQKRSIYPPNLLGSFNTKVLVENKWVSGLYDPPKIGEVIKLKGLHGSVIWPGFAVNKDKALAVITNDWSLISLSNGKIGPSKNFTQCSACHNDIYQQGINHFIGTRSKEDFQKIIKNGYQSMPSILISDNKLDEILNYLTQPNESSITHNEPIPLIRSPYKKALDQEESSELILIDILNGTILNRMLLDEDDFGLTIGGISIINDQYAAFTGTRDNKFKVIDYSSFDIISEIELSTLGSVSPLIFRKNNEIFALIAETGQRTLNLYDSSRAFGNVYSLYLIGKIN